MNDTATDPSERRASLRQRTFKTGRVVVKGVQTMECMIRNMSLTGARIAVANAAALPERFELFIGDEGMHREAEIMSRSNTSAGLRFVRPLSARELGAEFMSARSATRYREERERAAADAPPATPRVTVEAPPIASAAPDAGAVPSALVRLHHSELPPALARHLRWR